MNFEFSEDQKLIQEQARSFLAKQCPLTTVRQVLERDAGAAPHFDEAVWQGMVELGWAGVAIPEEYGGLGLGYLELCVIAEEVGRALAPVPFASTVYLAAECIQAGGTEAQKQTMLPSIADGSVKATVAFAENNSGVAGMQPSVSFSNGALSGSKHAVADATVADLLLVSAVDESGNAACYVVKSDANGLTVSETECVDPSKPISVVEFNACDAERLGESIGFEELWQPVFDRAAILFAFEQLGGSQACLDMAREYTMQRYAFGRPIASFQALKHKMADMFVAIELARSNAYYGAWALSSGEAGVLTEAAAVARISATDAYYECSKENMQAHGGMGYTWELDCHLYYRRSQYLAAQLGSQRYWKDRLIDAVTA